MRNIALFVCSFFVSIFMPVALCTAQETPLAIDLAEPQVDITTGFDGTRVVLYGMAAHKGANIAVTLKGPETTTVVRRKGRAAGIWLNRESVEFRRVPSYYDYAVRFADIGLFKNEMLMSGRQIGVENLAFYPEDADEDPGKIVMFREALIRNMQEKGFYPLRAVVPQFVQGGFFKVTFDLPPGVPTGLYTVEAVLASADGAELAMQTKTIRVGQVGFNAHIYTLASEHAVWYALVSIGLALSIGAGAFLFLRRD